MFVVDAHEDIAWSALTFCRDYTSSAIAIRESEANTSMAQYNGRASLGLKEWRSGQVAVIFATIFVPPCRRCPVGWEAYCYHNALEAHKLAQMQLDYYRRLEDQHQFIIIRDIGNLDAVLEKWNDDTDVGRKIGLVLLMEGADPIRSPHEAEYWADQGVRIIGPAWAGTRYSGGTGEPGKLTDHGYQLLEVMDDLGLILDLSHMSEESFAQALDIFQGTIIASHSNPRRIAVPDHPERSLSDEQIIRLAERKAVIGIVPYNSYLKTQWKPVDGKEAVSIERVAEAVDAICQITGSSSHVGIGSDFDGGFGAEAIPNEMDTVADLRKIGDALGEQGYREEDVGHVLAGNWISMLRRGLRP